MTSGERVFCCISSMQRHARSNALVHVFHNDGFKSRSVTVVVSLIASSLYKSDVLLVADG